MKNKKCESCKNYNHEPSIIGGIATCLINVQPLLTFWPNDACDKYIETKQDNLKSQNDYYDKKLGGAINLNKNNE